MRIAREVTVAVQRAGEEAVDDLPEAVALVLRELAHLLEAEPVDPLRDEHPLAAQRTDDIGDDDERVPAPAARDRPLRLGLLLVVELVGQTLLDLRRV